MNGCNDKTVEINYTAYRSILFPDVGFGTHKNSNYSLEMRIQPSDVV